MTCRSVMKFCQNTILKTAVSLFILSLVGFPLLSQWSTTLVPPAHAANIPDWGVLAINTDQPEYKLGQPVHLSFSVLNHHGKMVCDAQMVLEITHPDGQRTTLSSSNQTIVTLPECQIKDFTKKPDHEAYFYPPTTGKYTLKFTAETSLGAKYIMDSFSVHKNLSQEISRVAPTRLYPHKAYPISITITAHRPFIGTVRESVPESFSVASVAGQLQPRLKRFTGHRTELEWPVQLERGEKITLQYTIDAPNLSPEFYELGKLKLIGLTGRTVYEESRSWQVSGDATFAMQIGYYNGTGADNRAITGLGFSPDLVLIKDANANGSDGILWKSTSMSSEVTAKLGDAEADIATNVIQSLDSDGFTLGTNADVNGSNIHFVYIAFDGSDCTSSGTFCVGSYSGDGSTPRSFTSVGFQPNMLTIKRSGASAGVFATSDMAANTTQYWNNTNQDTGGTLIRSLDATGFTIGSGANVNTSANTYWFFAFKSTSGAFTVGTFTGTGASNARTGLGYSPDAVFIKNANATTATATLFNTIENHGNYTSTAIDAANATGLITSLDSDGFTAGTGAGANENTKTIYWFAFNGSAANSGSGTYSMAVGSYSGNGTSQSVTGLAFSPDLVIIKHSDQVTDQYAVFTTSVMDADSTAYFANTATNFTTGITSLNSDGFSVGAHATVNTSGDTYHWQAFGNAWKPHTRSGAANFMVGMHIGNGVDSRDIGQLPFQPDLIAIKSLAASSGSLRTSAQSGDTSFFFSGNASTTNMVQAINSDGFEVGTNARVNQGGVFFFYFAFKTGPNFKVGLYNGTGSAQSITAPNIQPDLVWIKNTSTAPAVTKPSSLAGDSTQPMTNVANGTGQITSLDTEGFSLGTSTNTNSSGTNNYGYAAWKIPTTYTQNDFEWYVTTNSVTLTDIWPLAAGGVDLAENAVLTQLPSTNSPPMVGDKIRIQMNMTIGGSRMGSTQQAFKIQYSAATDCTTAVSWTDVGAKASGSIWRLFDEASIGDSTTQVNQISTSNSSAEGYYSEINASATNPLAVPTSNNTEWDWPVENNGAAANTTYCFRMILDDGTLLNTYNSDSYPKLTTAPATDNLMRHGNFFTNQAEQGLFW